MIERASKAAYDYHHPGARPCPAAAAATGGGPLSRASREAQRSVDGSRADDDGDSDEVWFFRTIVFF